MMKREHISAQGNVMNLKICSRCNTAKEPTFFYTCKGKTRSECKACTIKRNGLYQQKNRSWKNRFVDNDEQKSYMTAYYAAHKDKFAQYRKTFREKHPEYFKLYSRKRKTEGWKKEAEVTTLRLQDVENKHRGVDQ